MRWTSSPFSQRSETSQARDDGVSAARQRPSHAFVSEKSEWVAARAYESLPFASKVMHPPAGCAASGCAAAVSRTIAQDACVAAFQSAIVRASPEMQISVLFFCRLALRCLF
jgi:hypothetical protein